MGFKPTACFGLGFFSFLGAIFYLISAYMVHNRNLVFISHKAGMDMFTSTEEEFHEKMMAMLITAGVSRAKKEFIIFPLDYGWINASVLHLQLLHG